MMTIWWFIELIVMIGGGLLFGYLVGMFMHSACVFNENPLKRLIALVFMMLFSVVLFDDLTGIVELFIVTLEAMP